jgi:hypothetical protein
MPIRLSGIPARNTVNSAAPTPCAISLTWASLMRSIGPQTLCHRATRNGRTVVNYWLAKYEVKRGQSMDDMPKRVDIAAPRAVRAREALSKLASE